MIVKHETEQCWRVECDYCDAHDDWADSAEEADGLAWTAGYEKMGEKHICPDCQHRIGRAG